jgi:hypothetical protein
MMRQTMLNGGAITPPIARTTRTNNEGSDSADACGAGAGVAPAPPFAGSFFGTLFFAPLSLGALELAIALSLPDAIFDKQVAGATSGHAPSGPPSAHRSITGMIWNAGNCEPARIKRVASPILPRESAYTRL